MNNKIKKIVLTGGPCGGKTSAIEIIKSHFEKLGYRILLVSEVATDLIVGGVSPTACGTNKDYQEAQVLLQITKELAYEKAANTMPCDRILIICDRGVMDNLAYMSADEFSDIIGGLGYSKNALLDSYDAVFHLETSAGIGAYTTENNSARTETAEEAIRIDLKLQSAWKEHKHFYLIENCNSFDSKITNLICRIETFLADDTASPFLEKEEKTVLAIGRWMPIHNGHKNFLVDLANKFDKLVVGIGSCYENGTVRNCIPAVEREILLRKIFKQAGLPDEKIIIIPISDRETFEEWINDVISICEQFNVTHFCTGNKEDILNVLEEKNIRLGLQMIDPEETSDIAYHATDVRNAILSDDKQKMSEMLPPEVMDIVTSQVKREVIAANNDRGRKFILGKQTVDVVFLNQDTDGEMYVLLGDRNKYKRDFPSFPALPGSGIFEYESTLDAATRVLRLETGIHCDILDKTVLPMPIQIKNGLDLDANMHFINIFSSKDMAVNGTMGGAAQCFAILTQGSRSKIEKCFYSRHDLENLRFVKLSELANIDLAYEQKEMVYEALDVLSIPLPEECLDVLNEDGSLTGKIITRRAAHSRGVLHGASHVCIYRKKANKLEILMQKRSENKDSFPNAYDLSAAGHIEHGSTFKDTAQKELFEELGIQVKDSMLHELLQLRISSVDRFHNDTFHNEEICKVYVMEYDIEPADCVLQKSEVSSVCWFDLSDVLEKILENDSLFCTNREEFIQISDALKSI